MMLIVACLNVAMLWGILVRVGRRESGTSRLLFWSAALIKLTSGLLLGLVYLYHYDGDTFVYFHDATKLTAIARTDFVRYVQLLLGSQDPALSTLIYSQPRALFMVKIVSLVNLISFDNYWISSAWLSLLSFLASWQIFKTVEGRFRNSTVAAALAFLFFPSVVFWSSGIVKETIAAIAIYLLSSAFLRLWFGEKLRWRHYLLLAVALFLFWELKYYDAVIFIPVAVAAMVTHWMVGSFERKYPAYVLFLVILAGLLLVGSQLHPNFYPDRLMNVIVENYNVYRSYSGPHQSIEYFNLQPNGLSMLVNMPWAVVSGFFRPFLFETGNGFQTVAAGENLIILVLCISFLVAPIRHPAPKNKLLGLAALTYCILLCALLALSTPNFGTLVRYRVGFLPFFIFLVTYRNSLVEHVRLFLKRSPDRVAP